MSRERFLALLADYEARLKALDQVAYKDPEPMVRIWAHMAVMSVIRSVDKERVEAIARSCRSRSWAAWT